MGVMGMSNLAANQERWTSERPLRSEVLILDDSLFDRKRMRRALSKLPATPNVTEISDLAGLDAAIRIKRFDVILVDYALTYGDGLQALAKIKASGLCQSSCVVMVTGNDSSSLAVNALKLGFDDYVTKDDLNADVLSKLLISGQRKAPATVIPFPSDPNPELPPYQFETSNDLSPFALEQMLQPAITAAMDRAMARIRLDDMTENVVRLVASFGDEDEFIFKDFH